jgi:phosphoribosylglycinamide formyltransferase-1
MPAASQPHARLAVLLSGSGRTLDNLLAAIARGELPARVALVIASRECLGAEKARRAGIETVIRPGRLAPGELGELLTSRRIDWVVLAGYLQLVPIPEGYRHRIVNIHPALLPSFGGPGMHGHHVHRAVIDAGCRVSGCTVHLCDDRYDTGPIIHQRACEVREDDTPDTLAARVFEQECLAYPEALARLIAHGVRVEGRRAFTSPAPGAPA